MLSSSCTNSDFQHNFQRDTLGEHASSRFSRLDLACARILGQIDKKFIACIISATSESDTAESLVLIDQHAADERIRVERLLQELCLGYLHHDPSNALGVETISLDPPASILLTEHEVNVLAGSEDIRNAFERWGFQIMCPPETSIGTPAGTSYRQVQIHAVPSVLGAKVWYATIATEPRILIPPRSSWAVSSRSLSSATLPM
jgi:DNA mismatch repair protein MLH3